MAIAAAVSITVDLSKSLFTASESYLSVNVDTGSLYNSLDFTSVTLRNLTRALVRGAPLQLRIGGGAADDTYFTGVGGLRGNCTGSAGIPPDANVCVDASLWAELMQFAADTGVRLVWDLNLALGRKSPADPWNSSNSAALIAHSAATGQTPYVWQLGNEVEDYYKRNPPLNLTGAQVAADYAQLNALLAAAAPAGVSTLVYGPDACCEDRHSPPGQMLHDFAVAAPGLHLAAITFHEYPLPRDANRTCLPAGYTNLTEIRGFLGDAITTYAGYAAPALAAGLPLVLGETATTALGGCNGLSNRFVAGFTFLATLGSAAESRVSQVNRQDLVGWSSQSTPSSYALLGPPGWSSGPLAPHPDFWVAILWKQLVGRDVLRSSIGGDTGDFFDAHAWCAAGISGGVVVTFTSTSSQSVQLALPPVLAALPREAFILTAPDGDVLIDAAELNGATLTASPDGSFAWPLPGMPAPITPAVDLPPMSLGFLVFADAHAAACE